MLFIEGILNFFAPYNCVSCGQEGSVLCDVCAVDSCPSIPSRCYRCKKVTTDFAVCESCRKLSSLKHVWVRSEYMGVPKKLIYLLKFKSARPASMTIANQIEEVLPVLSRETVIVHVPTATSRKRQRGFDHSKLIALNLAKVLDLSYSTILGRTGQARQVGASREERLKQLRSAFYVKKSVVGKQVLLVDDIVTTGGSMEAAASVLKAAGAKQVDAVAFAQK